MSGTYRQDLPPKGGYPEFNWKRTIPKSRFRAGALLTLFGVTTVYGVYQRLAEKKRRVSEKFEDVDIFNAMLPFLKAERDRNWLKVLRKNRDLENEIMKDVPGWKTGTWYGEPVYFTLEDKWWDPSAREIYAHSERRNEVREYMWHHHPEYSAPKFYDKYLPKIITDYIF